MSRLRSWHFFLAGVFLASLSGNLWQWLAAHPPRVFWLYGSRPGIEEEPLPVDLAGQLSLTDEQRKRLLDEVEPLETERKKLDEELASRTDELRHEILRAPEPDPAKVEALTQEVAERRSRILVLRVEILRRFRALLTPEQAEILARRTSRAPE